MSRSDVMRQGAPADAIDGVVPGQVAQPDSAEALAQLLKTASRDGQRTVLRGGGSKLGWGRVPAAVDLVVETTRLDRLVAHRHGDMTATVQAGMSLAALNARLAEYGQRLPVESAFERATIGGVLATNDSGPLRHRFGTPRDLLIGVTLALTDGRLVKSGGTVVKNVAGYDLGKLVCGSHGSLVAIADATFKLLPISATSVTLVASYADAGQLARDVAALGASQVEMAAFDVRLSRSDGLQILMRLASSPAATEALASEARRLLSTAPAVVTGDPEVAVWRDQVRMPWVGDATVLRLAWLPAKLEAVLALVQRLERHGCGVAAFAGRAGGAGLLSLEGEARACAAAVADLRASAEVGHVVVLQARPDVKQEIDVWGPPLDSAGMALALKRMFDPAGILNANRGPV